MTSPVTGPTVTSPPVERTGPVGPPAAATPVAREPGTDRDLVLFDGVCHLCQGSVRFVAERDPQGHFAFVPLQSAAGERLMRRHGLEASDLRSLVLLEGGRAYTKSTGALRIARRLSWPWRALGLLLAVPAPVRDAVYDWIARHRYRWFGRSDTCEIPSPRVRARLIRDTEPDEGPI